MTGRLAWKGEEPHGARLKFQVRSGVSPDALAQAKWRGDAGENSFYSESGAELRGLAPTERWIQYRVLFTSPDAGAWPVLTQVTIDLE